MVFGTRTKLNALGQQRAKGEIDHKLLKAERLRRNREEGLRFYQPHRQQLEFHMSRAEKRGLFGGNQSGKSWAGKMELAFTVGRVHPFRPNYPGLVYARDCCVSFPVLHSVIIPTYKRILPRGECILGGYDYEVKGKTYTMPDTTFEGKPRHWPGLRGGKWETAYDKEFAILYLADGSFIEFKTYQQPTDSFAGPPRHIISHDEEPPQDIYNENQVRQVTVGVDMLFTMTPLNYSAWIYSDIYELASSDASIDVFKMASMENPYADMKVLERIEQHVTDPAERAARLYGEFTYLEGRVWKEYGEHNLIDPFEIPPDWHRSVIIDPHPSKPTAVNWIAEDHDGRLYGYREADYKGDVEYICSQIDTDTGSENIDLWLIDPSANQKAPIRGQGRLIDEFRKYFPRIIPANNNRELGWDAVRSRCVQHNPSKKPMLMNFRSCPTTDHQMRNYSWKPPTKTGEDRNKPEVVKRKDDHCDNWRYRCMARRHGKGEKFDFSIGVYGNG